MALFHSAFGPDTDIDPTALAIDREQASSWMVLVCVPPSVNWVVVIFWPLIWSSHFLFPTDHLPQQREKSYLNSTRQAVNTQNIVPCVCQHNHLFDSVYELKRQKNRLLCHSQFCFREHPLHVLSPKRGNTWSTTSSFYDIFSIIMT